MAARYHFGHGKGSVRAKRDWLCALTAKPAFRSGTQCAAKPRAAAGHLARPLVIAAIVLWLLATPRVAANELSSQACRDLVAQRDALAAQGVAANLEKGPAWAQANLNRQQIAEVSRLIGLDETLKFKCPIGFQNAVVAAIDGEDTGLPPLPAALSDRLRQAKADLQRASLRAKRTRQDRSGPNVPLPVRNRLRQTLKPRRVQASSG